MSAQLPVSPYDWMKPAEALPEGEARLAHELLALSAAAHPAGEFVCGLGEELERQAAQQAARAARRKPWHVAWYWAVRLGAIALLAALLFTAMRLIPEKAVTPPVAKTIEPTPPARPTVTPTASESPGILVPPPLADCQDFRQALQTTLGLPVSLELDALFSDVAVQNLDANGRGCVLTFSADGALFPNLQAAFDRLQPVFDARGYQQNGTWGYGAGGDPSISETQADWWGSGVIYHKSYDPAQVWGAWRPAPGVACPTQQMDGTCDLPPAQRIYTLHVALAVDPLSPVVKQFTQLWLAGDPSVVKLFTPNMQAALGADPIQSLDRYMGVSDHLLTIDFHLDSSKDGSLIAVLDTYRRTVPGNVGVLPERTLLLAKLEDGSWRIGGFITSADAFSQGE